MKVRRQARATALQALFEIDCVGHSPASVLASRFEDAKLPEEAQGFARRLVDGVLQNLITLDDAIAQHATERPVEQIAIIDRNILRIACYEILIARDTPVKVAINEGVELAKLFGSDASPRFVNGVLGSLVAPMQPGGATPNKAARMRRRKT